MFENEVSTSKKGEYEMSKLAFWQLQGVEYH